MEKEILTTVEIPEVLHKRVKIFSIKTGYKMKQVYKMALEYYFENGPWGEFYIEETKIEKVKATDTI